MKRRLLVKSIAVPLVLGAGGAMRVNAQPAAKVPRIGVLRFGVPDDDAQPGFMAALAAVGYHDGKTIQVDWRWATRADVARRHAVELAGMGLDLIVASATPAALALRDAKPAAPIILAGVADPVGTGLVASLARPGGNITGLCSVIDSLALKSLERLQGRRVAVIGHRSETVGAGGLFSYGAVLGDQIRRAALVVDKILRGARPADIPVEQPMLFEFALNRKAAQTLGITLSQQQQLRADRVVE